jgi:hypothetical protein
MVWRASVAGRRIGGRHSIPEAAAWTALAGVV